MKLLTFIFSVIFSVNLFAVNSTDEFINRLENINSVSGQFVQTLTDAKGELLQESRGVFSLLQPGYFRWETQEPFPQLLVSDLQKIWLYDPDLEQVTVKNYDERIVQTPVVLFSGKHGTITESYNIEKLETDRYKLLPKQSQELFEYLVVEFSGEHFKRMVLSDSLGQETIFLLSETVYNESVDTTIFQFVPPAGAEIISSD